MKPSTDCGRWDSMRLAGLIFRLSMKQSTNCGWWYFQTASLPDRQKGHESQKVQLVTVLFWCFEAICDRYLGEGCTSHLICKNQTLVPKSSTEPRSVGF